ncbi:MAG: PD-(D/E)XK nuclease-like domain-containing protein [Phycisphaerae bacterium]|nr:PD-(D/E)XK nuclease-like domain-containing protein [Phycisphaerae bacterium]
MPTEYEKNNINESSRIHIDMDVLTIEMADDYHAKATEYMSSHQLMDFIKCPLLYYKKRVGLIEDKDSPSYFMGRAAHTRILEGRDIYQRDYAVGGPINPSTGKAYGPLTKKFADWQAAQGRPVISSEQAQTIEKMACGIAMNSDAVELISYGTAEGVVRTPYCGLNCQIRIDWLHPHQGIVDLKTCDDLNWFEADARRYRYHNQLAFYQAVLATAIGQYVPVHIIAIEKKEPFRCGLWRLSDQMLSNARIENEMAMESIISCYANDYWPSGYEEVRILDIC